MAFEPFDPRKNRLQQQGQQQQQPQQQPQPAVPVKSNLPSMEQPQSPQGQQQVAQAGQPQQTSQTQQRKPAVPITYQQQAGAVADPRFSQALAQKLQQDVAAKEAALQQQQQQFQQQLQQAGTNVTGAQNRVSGILAKIQAGTVTDAELQEYQNLQQAQYQGPTGLEGTANIAALSQLAASPALIAQQYAGFAPGGVSAGDFQRAMAGLQRSPELAAAQEAATGLAQQAMTAEEVATQQAALLKGQTEAAKEVAETGSKAAMSELTGQISEQTKAERESKEAALKKLKEGLFITGQVKDSDIRKLGLDPNDPNVANVLESMQGLDLKKMGQESLGLGSLAQQITGKKGEWTNISVDELDKKVQKIKDNQAAGNPVTPEEAKLASFYDQIGGLSRGLDEEATKGALSFAKKEDLSKINALRRLRGEAPLTEADIGKKVGGVSKETLANLTGLIKQGAEYSDAEAIKQERKKITDLQKSGTELGKFYGAIISGDTSNKKLDDLYNWAKNNKDWNPHASWLQGRLDRMKGFFGWDTKAVRDLAFAQQPIALERQTQYGKELANITKKEKERSNILRKVRRIKD